MRIYDFKTRETKIVRQNIIKYSQTSVTPPSTPTNESEQHQQLDGKLAIEQLRGYQYQEDPDFTSLSSNSVEIIPKKVSVIREEYKQQATTNQQQSTVKPLSPDTIKFFAPKKRPIFHNNNSDTNNNYKSTPKKMSDIEVVQQQQPESQDIKSEVSASTPITVDTNTTITTENDSIEIIVTPSTVELEVESPKEKEEQQQQVSSVVSATVEQPTTTTNNIISTPAAETSVIEEDVINLLPSVRKLASTVFSSKDPTPTGPVNRPKVSFILQFKYSYLKAFQFFLISLFFL